MKLYRKFFFHPDIMVIIFLLIIMFLFFVITFQWSYPFYFIIGLITFIISEYLTHRFLFHLSPPKNRFAFKFLKRLHYDHHVKPSDLKLLFLPIWYSLPVLCILSFIFFTLTGHVFYTLSFSLGLMFMLLVYEWTHFVAHTPIKPKTKVGQKLKKWHLLHHFKNEHYWYGVSTPLMDIIFRTLKSEKEVPTSETVKNLEAKEKRADIFISSFLLLSMLTFSHKNH